MKITDKIAIASSVKDILYRLCIIQRHTNHYDILTIIHHIIDEILDVQFSSINVKITQEILGSIDNSGIPYLKHSIIPHQNADNLLEVNVALRKNGRQNININFGWRH